MFDTVVQYWLAGGACVDLVLIVFGRHFLKTMKVHEIITVLGTLACAWPFVLTYVALHTGEEK